MLPTVNFIVISLAEPIKVSNHLDFEGKLATGLGALYHHVGVVSRRLYDNARFVIYEDGVPRSREGCLCTPTVAHSLLVLLQGMR